MKPSLDCLARWREARRVRALRRRESRHHAAPSANMDRLTAEAGLAGKDRYRTFTTIFGGGDGRLP